VLSRIAVLERENARLADENAQMQRVSAVVEPVAVTRAAAKPFKRNNAVLFGLHVVLEILGVILSP
jgi:hypothetical protein